MTNAVTSALPLLGSTRVDADTVMVELVGASSCALSQEPVSAAAIISRVPAHQTRLMPDRTDFLSLNMRATNLRIECHPAPCDRTRF